MASTINADDGVISGIAGVKTTADSTGALNIQTNGTTAISISAAQVVSFPTAAGISFGGQSTFAAGSAAAPSISVTGDTNTGIFFPAADTIAFTEGGVESMRIDSSGNVGLNVTPSAWSSVYKAFQLNGNAALSAFTTGIGQLNLSHNLYRETSNWKFLGNDAATLHAQTSGIYYWYNTASGTAGNNATLIQAMTLDASGRLGIGETSPNTILDIKSSGPTIRLTDTASSNAYGEVSSGGGNLVLRADENNVSASSVMAFRVDGTERMRLDSSGNLGIGTASPSSFGKLAIVSTGTSTTVALVNASASSPSNTVSTDYFLPNSFGGLEKSATIGAINPNAGGNNGGVLYFSTSSNGTATTPTERARITAAGNFLVGTTGSLGSATNGIILTASGGMEVYKSASSVAIFNRNTDDGVIISLAQADSVEGNISVSGTTVSYNGGHLSRYSQTTDNTRIPLLKGTVMTNLDQMAVWEKDGQPLPNEQLNCMKVSDVEGDVNVAGVFVNWDNDDDVYTNDMNIAITGDMIIRIAQGVVVQRGELLMSAGDGTAKPQGDDIIRSKTVAKVTSNQVTCTYDDGSYCVPCVLTAC